MNYNKTLVRVVKPSLFWSFFVIAAKQGFYIKQIDIMTAFFYDVLDENNFINQLKGYVIDTALLCYFWKTLYSLKQAPCIRHILISEILQRLEFTKTDANYSIFVYYDKSIFISVYIDNLFITNKDLNIINDLNNKLLKRFCMMNLGSVFHYFVIFVIWTRNSVTLNQKSYLEIIVLQFGIDICKLISSLMNFSI